MLLKRGMKGPQVSDLQDKLNRAHYSCGKVDGDFGGITESAVKAFQDALGLSVDGVVGDKTWNALVAVLTAPPLPTEAIDTFKEVMALSTGMPLNALDQRMSDQIKFQQHCDNEQGCRYGGWINPYWFDKDAFKKGDHFQIPLVGSIVPGSPVKKPAHGGTCSPWAGLIMGWYLCMNGDYNFRVGRSARYIATWKHDHKENGVVIPGCGDYSEVHGKLKLEERPLNVLYQYWDWLYKVNIVEMDHHIILILKVGGPNGLWLEDPKNPGKPLPSGIYRWAADGNYPWVDGVKYYSGTMQSFRMIKETETCQQKWDFYRVANVDPNTCAPTTGPWAGRKPWPMILEPSA